MEFLDGSWKKEVSSWDAMIKKFGYKNAMEIPKLDKIVVNMGVGEAKEKRAGEKCKNHQCRGSSGSRRRYCYT